MLNVGFGKCYQFIYYILHKYINFGSVFFLANSSMFYIEIGILILFTDMHRNIRMHAVYVNIYTIFKPTNFY